MPRAVTAPVPTAYTPPEYTQGVHVLQALWVVDPDLPARILSESREVGGCDERLADLRRLILDEIRNSARLHSGDPAEMLLNRRYTQQLMQVADQIRFKRPDLVAANKE